jgi:hypothetical protein
MNVLNSFSFFHSFQFHSIETNLPRTEVEVRNNIRMSENLERRQKMNMYYNVWKLSEVVLRCISVWRTGEIEYFQ